MEIQVNNVIYQTKLLVPECNINGKWCIVYTPINALYTYCDVKNKNNKITLF